MVEARLRVEIDPRCCDVRIFCALSIVPASCLHSPRDSPHCVYLVPKDDSSAVAVSSLDDATVAVPTKVGEMT
jgi:hypothetical protein